MTQLLSGTLALFLGLALAMPASPAVTPAPVDVQTVKKRIQQGHVLQSGLDVSVRVNGSEVVVSTMLSGQQKEPKLDCKIDAAMIAKTIFETPKSQFARVKVRFYDPKNLSRYYLVAVTAGDVAAFSSRRLSTQQFLESLEVLELSDAKPESSTTALAAASPGARTAQPAAAVPMVMPVPKPPQDTFITYESAPGVIAFDYPSTFSVVDRPDKDTLSKFEGTTIDGTHYEMTLSMAPAHGMNPDRFARFTDQLIFQSLSGYRRVRAQNVLIGKSHNMPAAMCEIDFGAEDQPTRLTVVHFRQGPLMYTLGFIAKSSEQPALLPLFNHTLLSIHSSEKPLDFQSAGGTINFYDSRIGIAFDYPKVWKDSMPVRPEFIKSLEGPMGPFLVELKLGDAHVPGVTSNRVIAELVEQRALRPMKSYQRMDAGEIVFGRNKDIHGYRLAARFMANGSHVDEHLVIFSHRGHHYCLSFLLFDGAPAPTKHLFDSILSSVELR
jgi:hypothetical protein